MSSIDTYMNLPWTSAAKRYNDSFVMVGLNRPGAFGVDAMGVFGSLSGRKYYSISPEEIMRAKTLVKVGKVFVALAVVAAVAAVVFFFTLGPLFAAIAAAIAITMLTIAGCTGLPAYEKLRRQCALIIMSYIHYGVIPGMSIYLDYMYKTQTILRERSAPGPNHSIFIQTLAKNDMKPLRTKYADFFFSRGQIRLSTTDKPENLDVFWSDELIRNYSVSVS